MSKVTVPGSRPSFGRSFRLLARSRHHTHCGCGQHNFYNHGVNGSLLGRATYGLLRNTLAALAQWS